MRISARTATIVALLALLISAGSTALAGSALINSTRQIRDGLITSRHIRNGTITARQLSARVEQLTDGRLLYGRIREDGTVDPVSTNGLTDAMVDRVSPEQRTIYCFRDLPFPPRDILATWEYAAIPNANGHAATSAGVGPVPRDDCPAGTQARVRISAHAIAVSADGPGNDFALETNGPLDRSFFVILIGDR